MRLDHCIDTDSVVDIDMDCMILVSIGTAVAFAVAVADSDMNSAYYCFDIGTYREDLVPAVLVEILIHSEGMGGTFFGWKGEEVYWALEEDCFHHQIQSHPFL